MPRVLSVVLCVVIVILSVGCGKVFDGKNLSCWDPTARTVQSFDFGWKFHHGQAEGADEADYDDSEWQCVDVPHDWSIEQAFTEDGGGGKSGGYLPLGIGWYRKQFRLAPDMRHKKVFVQFDGIYKNSDVWINGHHLGKRWYGYVSFQYDMTPYVRWDSANVIAVRVDNAKQSCRWYSGSGIYRHVWLTLTDKLHVVHWGTYAVTEDISGTSAAINIKTLVKNEYTVSKDCALRTTIVDRQGKLVAAVRSEANILAGGRHEFSDDMEIEAADLWSTESPSLYHAHCVLLEGDTVVDDYVTTFGVRQIRWDSSKGLFVNGKPVLAKGVCIHHDLGSLGSAFHDRAMERRLEVLKTIGCNAIRTSHNPPAPQLLEMCDRMGFLVIDEAFDKWGGRNHATWEQDWERDLRSMLWRDRNHPCVVLWSVGNEVRGQGSEESQDKLRMLVDYVHRAEPTRKVTCGAFPTYAPDFVNSMDIAGLNYQEQWFDDYRKDNPNIVIISTESYVYYRGRGDTHRAFYPVNPWFDVLGSEYVVGSFLWTGIDYLGEAVGGWPLHGWNCSLVDTCGFRRPISYFHQSVWADEPMVHIAVVDDSLDVQVPTKDHWDWPKMVSHWTLPELEGKQVKIVTFTNCRTVDLLVNGRSYGTKRLADFSDRMVTWNVPYEPGSIVALGRTGDRVVCSHELKTAGKAAKIVLRPDRKRIKADARDLCHVEVEITDDKGVLAPDAGNMINFELSGAGRIVGVDNGDLRCLESYKTNKRSAYYGRCLVTVQSTREPGEIDLIATSPGLASDRVTIETGK